MPIFILAAIALLLAAVLWYTQASGPTEKPLPEENPDQRLQRTLAEESRMADALTEAVRALDALMSHPALGGPGFLLVQFLPQEGCALVTAQYPNIREALYRRIVRQEADREALVAEGVPGALLAMDPDFEAESSGMILVSVRVREVPSAFAESLENCRERNAALSILAQVLEARLPRFSARIFGAELLLSPEREGAVISTGE